MQDGIIKGTGNSRYLKSIADFLTQYPTYNDFVAALVAGTLPIDLNGINPTGWDQLGTALNTANLLSAGTVELSKAPSTSVVTGDINYRNGLAYGNGLFVSGASQKMYYSEDLITWVDSGFTADFEIKQVVFAANIFVAVGWGGSIGNIGGIIYSLDGKVWQEATYTPPTKRFERLYYVNGKFFTYAESQSTSEYYYSNDGITWTSGTLPAQMKILTLCFGNGTYILAGSQNYFMSSDGLDWTQKEWPNNYTIQDIAYGFDTFVALAVNSDYWLTSQNGLDWEKMYVPGGSILDSIFFLGEKFISFGGNDPIYSYSSDGQSWTGGVIENRNPSPYVVFLNQKYYVAPESNGLTNFTTIIDFSDMVGPSLNINTPDEMYAYILQQLSTINMVLSALTT